MHSFYTHTHIIDAPMDTDLVTDSPYYQILKTHRDKLNFLMPQFYNGITKPINGFTSALAGRPSLDQVYSNLANDMFQNDPQKIVFGFCIADCGGTGSNTNAAQAVTVLQQVKDHNNGEFACNGGAFFWVVSDDVNGAWSDLVYDEVSQTAGCSSSEVTTTLAPPSTTDITSTVVSSTTTVDTTQGTTSQTTQGTTATTTQAPQTSTSVASTTSSSNQSTSTELPPSGLCSSTSHDGCTSNQEPRCGRSEIDAREHCNAVCQVNTDCPSVDGVQQFCWGTHANYCGSFPKRTYSSPVQAHGLRCGFTEVHARTFCGVSCSQNSDCAFMGAGAGCHNTHSNYCGSDYTTGDSPPPPVTTTQVNTSQQTTQATTSQQVTTQATTSQTTTASTTSTTTTTTTESVSSGHCTPSCSTCSPYTLTELRAMGNTNWITSQSNCDKCANGYQWWPCNVDICKCGN